jgi:glycosyltransferase involved in cell wall biosynthesis
MRSDETIPVLLMARELGWGGGIERDVSKFARNLRQHGFAPHVACFAGGGARWQEIDAANIPLLTLPTDSLRSWATLRQAKALRAYLVKHRIQLVHAFDAPTDMFAVPVARLVGLPSIASHLWLREMLPRSEQLLLSVVDRLATALFANCHAVARQLAVQWRVSAERIHVCHNGVETGEFHAQDRQHDALRGAGIVVGTLAVLRPEKNIQLLLEAFARVLPRTPGARLLIVGDGPMRKGLEAQVVNLGIRHACVFEGATTTPARWLRAMDVFVLPSRFEAFSNALLEAMACGCCPIGANVGGTPELIEHGVRGLLFESEDLDGLAHALERVVLDSDQRARFSSAAASFVEQHLTIEHQTARLAEIYRTVLADPRSPRRRRTTSDTNP